MSIFKISVGKNFFEAFVQGFHQRHNLKDFSISEYMIILPSQQAVNFMKMEFLKNSSNLLPTIYSIGNIPAEEIIAYLAREQEFGEIAKFKPLVSLAEQKIFVKQLLHLKLK